MELSIPRDGSSADSRLLVVGIDAGSPALLRRWAEAGDLPNVARLMRGGTTRDVRNPYALEAGSVWPVFHSGRLPGRQPQYDGRRVFTPGDYGERWYGPEETPPPFWRDLADQGVRCLVLDPPYTHVDPDLGGTMVVDWAGHVPADGRTFALRTQPPELAEEILRVVGPAPAGATMCDRMGPETIADHRRFRDTYLRRIELKGRLASHLLETRPWDLALLVSCDLHCTGHHLWHVNDRGHPRWSHRLETALGEPLRECYRAFDQSLGGLLESVGPETRVMLFGSHGMGPSYSGTGLLDRMLQALDAPVRPPTARSARGRLRGLWKRLPPELRGRLGPVRRRTRGALRQPRFLPDRAGRRFFEVHANNATGGVRLNVEGREAGGRVKPAEIEGILARLADELRAVENAETGEPVAADVVVTRERYPGPYADRMPDLLVRWNRSAPIRRVRSPAFGELVHDYGDNRTGDHTPDGICIVAGPGVEAGVRGASVTVADFAPTIAACFGRRMEARDGRPFPITREPLPA